MKSYKINKDRPEVLDNMPLRYAPQNELGVVFLFSNILKKYRLRVDEIRPFYPDCIAYQKVGNREKMIRIEFEYKSRNFKTQNHNPKGCDWIVCWEHNWPEVPKNIRVLELKREFGLGFNIWIQPVGGEYKEILSKTKRAEYWSVPSLAHKGDLLLYYHTSPEKCIKDIFQLVSDVRKIRAGWKKGKDYMGTIRRICQLKAPIYFEDMKRHHILKTSFFIRGSMLGRPRVTDYWPYIYDMIIKRNPNVKRILKRFAPDRI